MPAVIWALLFGNFAIGTGVMVVAGTLHEISASLQVTVPVAGQLISSGALLMCVAAPLLAAVVSGWDRRVLLVGSLLWYSSLHLLCASMPTFGSLLPVRVLAMLAPAVFTPQAAACVGYLVPAASRDRAIATIFLGWSVASVLGMPLGAWLGGTFGWRSAFALIGLLSLTSAAWIWTAMPTRIRPPALSRAAWRETLTSPALMLCAAVTVLCASGQFVLFAYLAPYYRTTLGTTPLQLSFLYTVFGFFGLVGNLWMTRHIMQMGAPKAVMISIGGMAASMVLWPLSDFSIWSAALVSLPWALGCFAANSAQQARLVGISPSLASASIALNTSGMYAGQAIGAATGGWMIARDQMGQLHWAALLGLLLAMAVSLMAARVVHPVQSR